MSLSHFVGLPLGHEIGSHTLEFVNGGRSAMRLLSNGLDRYEWSNEGRAVVREQLARETMDAFYGTMRWQDIMRRHLATSLGVGLAGQPMNFAEVYK
jgi:hypothetical protein